MYSLAVRALMVALARELGFDAASVHSAGMAGLLHDLGKAVMPMDLLKKPAVLGVVLEQSEKSLTKPRIKIFYSIKNNERVIPWVVDLSHPDVREKIVAREDPVKWKFPDLLELWSGLSQPPW